MISEKLYELAFEYKKTKLWQKMWDMQVFAVKLSEGRIGYISIMGAIGEYCALGLYIGEKGFSSLRAMIRHDSFLMSPFEAQENLVQQECLQCAFAGKDDLSEEERTEVKDYARSHKIKLGGKNTYPQFLKLQRGCYPWYLQTEQEQEDLCQALAAAIELSRHTEGKRFDMLGLDRIDDKTEEVPMLVLQDGAWLWEKAPLPEEKPEQWPSPLATNDVGIASLKKAKRMGVWECEIIRALNPVRDSSKEVPYFPLILLAVNSDTNYILPVAPVENYEEQPEELLKYFMESLVRNKVCPKEIKVRDQRTYAFAKDLCDRLKITLTMEEEGLWALEEAEESFLARFNMSEEEEMEEIMGALDALLEMDKEELKNLPNGMVDMLKELMEHGELPKNVEKKLNQVFHFKENGKNVEKLSVAKAKKNNHPAQSYVISVSLGTGCYRHIQISENSTLEELHWAILDAFEFDDDHAHVFFMDNRLWSDYDSYYAAEVADGSPTTKGRKLSRIGLYKGKAFKYVFDFGDEWTFQCKVLRVVEKDTERPVIIKSKGEAPPQYGDSDDDWNDDWGDDDDE